MHTPRPAILPGAAVLAALGCLCAPLPAQAAGRRPENLPRPDDRPADMSKPVQVFILMGQSNMLGFGNVAALAQVVKKGRFTHLMDDQGNWTTRKDVRNVRVMFANGNMQTFNNEWLTVSGKNFGPEIGFGHIMGQVLDAPVLILKSCIGNRALGWDLLPPGSEGYEHDGKAVPGYQGSRDPAKRPKGTWYAGKQYDDDTDCVRKVLADLGKYYPGARRYEIAGFVWWQGHKDQRAEWAVRYEQNLVQLIKSLRKDFKAPGAPFVCATIGFGGRGMRGHTLTVAEAQLAVADPRKYPEFRGNVKTVDSRPFWRGGGAHYGGNPETYMEVGVGLGWAMAELLEGKAPGGAVARVVDEAKLEGSLQKAFRLLAEDRLAPAEQALRPYLAAGSQKDPQQVSHARKLAGYLDSLVEAAIADAQRIETGDVFLLKAALDKHDRTFAGVAAYEERRKQWAADLGKDTAVAELAVGAKLHGILARKDKLEPGAYYRLLDQFEEEHPDSFYAGKATEAIQSIVTEVEKSIAEIRALGAKGDVYAMFERIDEAKTRYAKIPAFDSAQAAWVEEYKQPETRRAYAAGKAYAKIFEDLDSVNAAFRKLEAKNSRIRSKNSRTKAEETTKRYYASKLQPLASRLEKLAETYPDTYYGKGAKTAVEAYAQSLRQTLADPLARR